jgi:hypothetical protein
MCILNSKEQERQGQFDKCHSPDVELGNEEGETCLLGCFVESQIALMTAETIANRHEVNDKVTSCGALCYVSLSASTRVKHSSPYYC